LLSNVAGKQVGKCAAGNYVAASGDTAETVTITAAKAARATVEAAEEEVRRRLMCDRHITSIIQRGITGISMR
jgi:hypothetical protein